MSNVRRLRSQIHMPLITVTLQRPKTPAFKSLIMDTVHEALKRVGVPATDKFQRVLELDPEDFRFDPSYPDVNTARTSDFVLVEILWSVGRSAKVKKELLSFLMHELASKGIDTENVMVVFKETQWENWSFAGGRLIHT
jgi:phenylpyruvate tautomerase PptA (4-oxalocrotonate tautomerase family)